MISKRDLVLRSISMCTACVPLAGGVAAAQVISIPMVPVINSGNPSDPDNGFGTVNYQYNIGEYDVTSGQYCAFLNAVAANDTYGIYHPSMAGTTNGNPGIIQSGNPGRYIYTLTAGRANYPITDVDYWNAARFANWLNNGQPIGQEGAGSTENGAYDLFDTGMDHQLLNTPANGKTSITSSQSDNDAAVRSASAMWVLPNENEWYKGAYYDPNRNQPLIYGGNFWDYPTRTDDSHLATPEMNVGSTDSTPVGSYPFPSAMGTYDQGGNVYEWDEKIVNGANNRGLRGGSFTSGNDAGWAASFESTYLQPWIADHYIGFRVVQLGAAANSGLIDVQRGKLILSNQRVNAIATIMMQLKSGYNNGLWNGATGITSSAAAGDSTHLTAVGAIINDTGANTGNSTGTPLFTTLDGSTTSDGDLLIKYTYYGDSNLSGRVDGSDYSLIDNGYERQLTGWYNGDYNYDGVVNGSDFTLIDNTFNQQGASLASAVAVSTAQIGGSGAVPEPGLTGLVAVGVIGLLRRRQWVRCKS